MIALLLLALAQSAIPQSQAPAHAPRPQAAPNGLHVVAPPAQSASDVATDAPAPLVEPYHGSLSDGLAEMRALTEGGKGDEALALGERILAPDRFAQWREEKRAKGGFAAKALDITEPAFAFFGFDELSSQERAAVCYAQGLAATSAKKSVPAELAFQRARALAGPSELRLAATYDLGVLALQDGEELRAKIPEISGQQPPQPQVPAITGGGGPGTPGAPGGAPQEPDPLDLARAAYTKAREHLVERVRLDWHDADTRANLELVARRLKELDEIQKKREEQKKQQEQNQDEQKDSKDQKNQDDKKNQDKKDGDKDSKKDDSKSDPNKPDDQKDGNKDQQKQEDQKPEEKPAEQKPEDKKADEKKPDESQQQPGEERVLTKEEMTRLLDILNQREQEGRQLLEKIRQARRVAVKKDW